MYGSVLTVVFISGLAGNCLAQLSASNSKDQLAKNLATDDHDPGRAFREAWAARLIESIAKRRQETSNTQHIILPGSSQPYVAKVNPVASKVTLFMHAQQPPPPPPPQLSPANTINFVQPIPIKAIESRMTSFGQVQPAVTTHRPRPITTEQFSISSTNGMAVPQDIKKRVQRIEQPTTTTVNNDNYQRPSGPKVLGPDEFDVRQLNRIEEQKKNAHYSFSSKIENTIDDNAISRSETRQGLKLTGQYSYSDGFFKRIVHYEADENGYRVVREELEPIGDGPQYNPKGRADVSTDDYHYSITTDDVARPVKQQRVPVNQ